MANKKFSEFVLKTSTSDVSHIVGYNGAENVQITPANFVTGGGTGVFLPLAGGIMVGDTTHNDNVKSIYGTSPGNDLQIYHSGTDGFIANATGDLKLSATNFRILKPGLGEFIANFFSDGAVELFNNNSKKFETTSTGISVTGNGVFTENAEIRSGNKLILQRPNNAVATEISTDVNGTMILNSVNDEGFKLQNSGVDLLEIGNVSPTGAIFAGDVSVGSGKFLRFPTAGGTGGNASINYDVSAFTLTSNNVNAPIIFKTSSAEKMRLDASGNLGIGLSNQTIKLSVLSSETAIASFDSTNSTGGFTAYYNSGSVKGFVGYGQTLFNSPTLDNNNFGIRSQGSMPFAIGGETILYISSSKNLGIGTVSPSAKLDIDVTTEDNQPALKVTKISDQGENAMEVKHVTSSPTRGIADFSNGAGSVMFIRGDGNVGVGTVSPNIYNLTDATNILSVQATGTNKGGIIDISASGTGYSGINIGNESIRRGGIYSLNGSDLAFYTNATNSGVNLSERMRINSAGQLLIGATSGISDGAKLEVNGDLQVNEALYGKNYPQTSTLTNTSVVDTGIVPNAGVYEFNIMGNPNDAGSSSYKSIISGLITVSVDFIGGIVSLRIATQVLAQQGGGSSNVQLTVGAFMQGNGSAALIKPFSGLATEQIRILVGGYTATIGNGQFCRINRRL